MKLLDRFEQSMERLLEGSVGAIFRQKMQPAEIETALERAMFDNRQVSVGGIIVPNSFTVALNPSDYAQFSAYVQGLASRMERFLFDRATEENASVLGRIRVELVEDPTTRRGRPAITCAITDMHAPHAARRPDKPPPADATQPFRPRGSRPVSFALRGIEGVMRGETIGLDRPEITIGRATTNGIVIPGSDVSRYHARIELIDGVPRVEDIESKNGTRVNGEDIRLADLAVGDRIAFGSQVFELVDDRNGRPR